MIDDKKHAHRIAAQLHQGRGRGHRSRRLRRVTLSAKAASELKFDAEYDIVVCGGGGGGLPCALFSRWLGNRVAILEKAGSVGGTAAKAAFWYWVPNNEPMRRAGIADPKADYLRYVARLSRPEQYDPSLPKLGLSDWEYEMCEAIYDSASPAAELLASKGALPYRHEVGARLLGRIARRQGADAAASVPEGRSAEHVGRRARRDPHAEPRPRGATVSTFAPGIASRRCWWTARAR